MSVSVLIDWFTTVYNTFLGRVCFRYSIRYVFLLKFVFQIIQDPLTSTNVDLKDIKIFKKLGGTVDDSEMVQGVIFDKKSAGSGGVTRVEKAKVGLIQFCLSPPKTDMENNVIVSDYTQMDRVLREERRVLPAS